MKFFGSIIPIFTVKYLGIKLQKLLFNHSDPKILPKRDRFGNTYFRVYDHQTGFSTTFSSEAEVRFWLEERYYQ